jgi:hypothetical protein
MIKPLWHRKGAKQRIADPEHNLEEINAPVTIENNVD